MFMTRRRTVLFAVAGGLAVGNLYWAQPLLDLIAKDLSAPTSSAGWLVTSAQLGYAAGIVLIVPLGDVVNRRRLTSLMMGCSALCLAACALAPTFGTLLVALALLGLSTVTGQVLTPLASDLTHAAQRGRVVGTVVSGMVIGILVSRTISGLVAEVAGWRSVFAAASIAAGVVAVCLYRSIPPLRPKTRMAYPALIRSVAVVVRREPTVRWTIALTALRFGGFSMFWTALTFLLSAPPFSYPPAIIGLFGLAGLAGAVAAQRTGRLHDRGWSVPATGAACLFMLLSYVLAAAGARSLALLLIAVVALDISVQALSILNQARAFAVSHEQRSRINTAVVTGNFAGGVTGSAMAPLLWSIGGWTAVTAAGMVLSASALVVWALGRSGPLRVPAA
jgi:predicted MFS family arabinose efflux permease